MATPSGDSATSGATLVAAALAGAWAAQLCQPQAALTVPGAPWNWIIPALPAAALITWRIARPQAAAWRVAGSAGAAIAALAGLGLACLPLAVWPSGTSAPRWLADVGLADATRSLPFAVAWVACLGSLAIVVGARLAEPRTASLAWWRSLLIHVGLLIAVVGGTAASGTLVRGRLQIEEGRPGTTIVHLPDGMATLPVSIALNDFRLDRFPPVLLVWPAVQDQAPQAGEQPLGADAIDHVAGWSVRVVEWLPAAAVVGGIPRPYHAEGALPAARVEASSGAGAVAGWLHPQGPFGAALMLDLPGGSTLSLSDPRPRRFAASVSVAGQPAEIAVNMPLHVPGWTLYLTSYDEALGGASPTVVLEAVADPALPGVYAGLALLLLGMALFGGESLAQPPRPEPT